MIKRAALFVAAAAIVGCASTGLYTETGGGDAKSQCMSACTEFKEDGTGCAKFTASVSDSCAGVVERVCKAAPQSCGNK